MSKNKVSQEEYNRRLLISKLKNSYNNQEVRVEYYDTVFQLRSNRNGKSYYFGSITDEINKLLGNLPDTGYLYRFKNYIFVYI